MTKEQIIKVVQTENLIKQHDTLHELDEEDLKDTINAWFIIYNTKIKFNNVVEIYIQYKEIEIIGTRVYCRIIIELEFDDLVSIDTSIYHIGNCKRL